MSKIALNSHIKLKHPEKIEGKIKKGRGITLPNAKVSCYFNTSDSKCYKPNDKVKIYYGTHFITK